MTSNGALAEELKLKKNFFSDPEEEETDSCSISLAALIELSETEWTYE